MKQYTVEITDKATINQRLANKKHAFSRSVQ